MLLVFNMIIYMPGDTAINRVENFGQSEAAGFRNSLQSEQHHGGMPGKHQDDKIDRKVRFRAIQFEGEPTFTRLSEGHELQWRIGIRTCLVQSFIKKTAMVLIKGFAAHDLGVRRFKSCHRL